MENDTKTKKNILKKWWFWTIIVVVFIVMISIGGDDEEKEEDTASTDIVIQETVEPTDKPTIEPTDKPTAEPTDKPTAEPTEKPNNDYKLNLILSMFEESLEGIFDVELDVESKTFNIIPIDTDFSTELTAVINGDLIAIESWEGLVDEMKGLSQVISDILPGCTINIVNPLNKENTLLMVMDGVVIYDFSEE